MVNICFQSNTFCIYFIHYLPVWIRIPIRNTDKSPENGPNLDTDPHHGFKDGFKEGYGVFEVANGDVYRGFFIKGNGQNSYSKVPVLIRVCSSGEVIRTIRVVFRSAAK